MQTRNRLKPRYDRFTLRGWTYPFHQIRDQGKLAALVPESDEPRTIVLWSGHEVEIRKGDVALIYPQINWPVPGAVANAAAVSTAALDKAAAAVKAMREAAAESAPVSSVDDLPKPEPVVTEVEVEQPKASPALLALMAPGETVRQTISRLTDELRKEWDRMTNLQLQGAGDRVLTEPPEHAGKTVSIRHSEISTLLKEFEALGAEHEVTGG